MSLLIFYIFIALSFSFMCSLMEVVLLSVPHSYIAVMEKNNPKAGKQFRTLKTNIDRPLAAILSLNTIAHTAGAAGAGAQAVAVFGNQYVGVISAVLTLLILVISELIPKSLGASYWRQLARPVSVSLNYLIPLMLPFVWISKFITALFSSKESLNSFCKEEFTAMAELGEKSGKLRKQETRILRSLFRFNSLQVKDVMTPRTVVFALEEEVVIQDVLEKYPDMIFSRIPVYSGNIDRVTGYAMKHEILKSSARDEHHKTVSKLKRKINTVPETMSLPDIFDFLLNGREHLSLVVDEYGGTAGIVTLEDIVETLLGMEIVDELDTNEDMRALAHSKWQDRARRMMKE
jgi:CBS domain containing-hemolysin-like protein